MKYSLQNFRFYIFLCALGFLSSSSVLADDPPQTDHGTIGGDKGGAKLDKGDGKLEDALGELGIIGGKKAGTPKNTGPKTVTGPGEDGGTRTVTTHPDGSRTIALTGRNVEPTNITMIFDKNGSVIKQDAKHSDGKTDTMTYSPKTGKRHAESLDPKTGIKVVMDSKDGQGSTMVLSNPGQPDQTTVEDANGNKTETVKNPNGTSTVRSIPRGGKGASTTTYGSDGKPDESETREYDHGYLERRITTEFDVKGNPTKTTVKGPARYDGESVLEETDYWPGTSIPKITKRRDKNGDITEVFYYDKKGKLDRRTNRPGHEQSDEQPFHIQIGKPGGFIHLRTPDPNKKKPLGAVRFGDDLGGFGAAERVDSTGIAGFDGAERTEQRHYADSW